MSKRSDRPPTLWRSFGRGDVEFDYLCILTDGFSILSLSLPTTTSLNTYSTYHPSIKIKTPAPRLSSRPN